MKKLGRHKVAEAMVPANGIVRLENLPGAEREMSWDDWEKRGGVPFLDVLADSHDIGTIKFYELDGARVLPPADGATSKTFEFRLPPLAGDVAPEIELIDAQTSLPVRLADLRGKVVLLDFWATWCPPCQPGMADLQKVVREHRDQWNDEVIILTISIDDDMETLRKHLARRGWKDTQNAWTPPDPDDSNRSGFYAPGAETYGINETPTMLLIDRNGRISLRGRFDAAKEINALLKSTPGAGSEP